MSQPVNRPLRKERGKAAGDDASASLMSPETGLSIVPLSIAAGDRQSFDSLPSPIDRFQSTGNSGGEKQC